MPVPAAVLTSQALLGSAARIRKFPASITSTRPVIGSSARPRSDVERPAMAEGPSAVPGWGAPCSVGPLPTSVLTAPERG